MRCKFCGSKAIYPYTQHEHGSAGRVVAGAIIAGPVGAAVGLAGKNVKGYRCSACGMFSEQVMGIPEELSINSAVRQAQNGDTISYERYRNKYANLEFVSIQPKGQPAPALTGEYNNESEIVEALLEAEPEVISIKHSYSPNQFVVGSPVFISNVTIKDDNGEDVLLLDINNISGKTLRSVYLSIIVYDDVGDQISTSTFAYQGLSAATGEALPQAKPFNLNTNVAYKVDVTCEKAAFTDDTVWRKEENPKIYSVPEKTELVPESFAQHKYLRVLLAKKGALRVGQKLYYPVAEEAYRLCVCGNPAVNGSKCLACGLSEADLQEVMDYDALIQCHKDVIAKKAKERAETLQTLRQSSINGLYQEACALMERDNISDCEKAIEYFRALIGHKDTAEQIQLCKSKIDDICKQASYNNGISLMQKHPVSKENLEAAILEFQKTLGWKDADEQITTCQQRIAELEEAHLQRGREMLKKEQQKKNKKVMVIIAAILAFVSVFLIISGINTNKCKEANAALVGKTFEGTCYSRYYTWEYQIEFISETHCKIASSSESRNGSTTYTNTETIPNATYRVEGGIGGLTLVFDDWGCDGAEPFQIEINGNTISMHTTNYNSGIGMTLKEVG